MFRQSFLENQQREFYSKKFETLMRLIEHEPLAHFSWAELLHPKDFLRNWNAESHEDTEKIRLWYARLRTFENGIGSRNWAAQELLMIDCNCKICDG